MSREDEKPDFVWDIPEFDHLYMKRAEEFEWVDDAGARSGKLDLEMAS